MFEVYGMDGEVELENGKHIKLFKLLHSMELMTAFFKVEHIAPFQSYSQQSGNWIQALGKLAMDGLVNMQNRFPLTWAEPEEKA